MWRLILESPAKLPLQNIQDALASLRTDTLLKSEINTALYLGIF